MLAIGLGIMNLSAAIHNIGVVEPYTDNSLLSGFREFFNNIFGQVFLCIVVLMLAIVGIKECMHASQRVSESCDFFFDLVEYLLGVFTR